MTECKASFFLSSSPAFPSPSSSGSTSASSSASSSTSFIGGRSLPFRLKCSRDSPIDQVPGCDHTGVDGTVGQLAWHCVPGLESGVHLVEVQQTSGSRLVIGLLSGLVNLAEGSSLARVFKDVLTSF